MSLETFLRLHSSSKEAPYLPWQNKYPNLKTNCHVKPEFSLWAKLLENLIFAKYLISAAAALMVNECFQDQSFGRTSAKSYYYYKFYLKFFNMQSFKSRRKFCLVFLKFPSFFTVAYENIRSREYGQIFS